MATYKVIQDIEAEDKIVGPFSLRQFVYAGVAAFCGYLCFLCISKGAAFLIVGLIPPMLFCMFFAWPWSPDQPTEVWALARIRFYFKPRKRVWDQSGAKELVTITVPKKIEKTYTDGLSENEVKSRLHALSATIDSRGWVIKNSTINLSTSSAYVNPLVDDSDRLISYDAMPREVPDVDVLPADDILDEQNNPVAHQFDQMINASTKAHRAKLMDKLRASGATVPATEPAANDNWFTGQSPPSSAFTATVRPGASDNPGPVAADPTADDQALAAQIIADNHVQQATYSHLKTIAPPGQAPVQAAAPQPEPPMPTSADAAILNLANNNDLNVATLAREANKAREPKLPTDDEVVISLH